MVASARLTGLVFATLALATLGPGPARADLPDIPLDTLLATACESAKRLDSCPRCKCEATTSTSPISAGEASDIPYAVVFEISGLGSNDLEYRAAHVALGNGERLAYAGRLGQSLYDGDTSTSYVVEAKEQRFEMCPGACDYDAVGLVHFLTVAELAATVDSDNSQQTFVETTSLVACFESHTSASCWRVPLSWSQRLVTLAQAPGDKERELKKTAWKRTWKLQDKKNGLRLALGKATGKGDGLPDAKSPKDTGMMDLSRYPGVSGLVR